VPLFNAIPVDDGGAAVDLWPIVRALEQGATTLATLALPDDAPPAFLLDANRRGLSRPPPGQFDNRSICTRFDFPPATELLANGIAHVVALTADFGAPLAADLASVLLGFQVAGLAIYHASSQPFGGPIAVELKRPSLWRRLNEKLHVWSLARTSEGAFGRTVPHTS
jgi:hypothetical protein